MLASWSRSGGSDVSTPGRHQETWRTDELRELLRAVVALRSVEEAEAFFRDLCTLSELEALAHRWEVARLLDEGLPYGEISRRTGASTTTVTRVAHWLRHGEGGYARALERRRRGTRKAAPAG
jgi:TrpR-related protein YerC/YecD